MSVAGLRSAISNAVEVLDDARPGRHTDPTVDDGEWLRAEAAARRRFGAVTARNAGLYACAVCGLLSERPTREEEPAVDREERMGQVECPRCGAELHVRKPASLSRTWAYVIAGAVLYIPANVFPITHSETLISDQSDTIFSGVVFLAQEGSWPLAALVFFVSIVVPFAKLIILASLLASVHYRTLRRPAQRTRLFRIVEFIGRWSMLDIFAVAMLAALVQLKSLAELTPGPAAVAFGGVCVLTILASQSFDPRLIWDAFDEADNDPDEGYD